MTTFGKLRHLRKETAKINRTIEEEFEQIEPEAPKFRILDVDDRQECPQKRTGNIEAV